MSAFGIGTDNTKNLPSHRRKVRKWLRGFPTVLNLASSTSISFIFTVIIRYWIDYTRKLNTWPHLNDPNIIMLPASFPNLKKTRTTTSHLRTYLHWRKFYTHGIFTNVKFQTLYWPTSFKFWWMIFLRIICRNKQI